MLKNGDFPLTLPIYLLVIAVILAGAALYLLQKKNLVIKGFVTCFIIVYAALSLISRKPDAYAILILLGMLIGLFGDIFIAKSLLAGMALFAAGHFAYIGAIITLKPVYSAALPLFLMLALCGFLLFRVFKLDAGPLLVPTAVYAGIIFAMAAMAISLPRAYPYPMSWAVALGSIFFVVSDALLALLVMKGLPQDSKKTDYISLSAYYIAQSLFALSLHLS